MTEKTEQNYEMLKQFSLTNGASLFGVADVSTHKEHIHIYPSKTVEKMNCAISLGFHLSEAVLETIIDRPNKLYHRHYKMVNILLDQLALRVGDRIQQEGFDYIPIPASQMLDWEKPSSHASHRAIGELAGLGWRGRNNLLVNPLYGARVRYVSILTDMPLKTDRPVEPRCGKCTACIEVCPAGALTEEGYQFETCDRLLKHFGKTLHVSLICGVCQKACRGNNPLWEKE